MLLAVPAIHVLVSPLASAHASVVCAGSAFQPIWAARPEEVSNTCGVWPGPGTLCTRVPAGMRTFSGEPGALDSVNASAAEAATPGEGSYPTRAASSITERWSTAVRRNASLAKRS